MCDWKNMIDFFSEDERYYKNTYLEINEVYDEQIEVSLFSSRDEPYEIYFSYGIFYGIIYVDGKKAHSKREEVKSELVKEHHKHKEPTDEFINEFCKKHEVCMPNDILFDRTDIFGF
ncbi:MAG: hypothetical protein GX829_05995 [Clostridium sp.]|jgi:hypothetical protein|nr:hypothetical protein [Clostridium sp.]